MAEMTQLPEPPGYPANLTIDYPDRDLNRLTTFFRLLTVIPIYIVLSLLSDSSSSWNNGNESSIQYASAGLVVLPLVLMILFRQKYPRWWFDWNLELTRFSTRVGAYFLLLRDEYPSTDEEQAVHIDIPYPDAQTDLNRWLPLVKWLLAIPHYLVLIFLGIVVLVCSVIAWFAILFTKRYPPGLFEFVVGVFRWGLRVEAYMLILTTDRYPPFRMSE